MIEPLHEAACRVVMQLAAEDGEIGSALRAYADLYNALGEELDMEPYMPFMGAEKLGEVDMERENIMGEPICMGAGAIIGRPIIGGGPIMGRIIIR